MLRTLPIQNWFTFHSTIKNTEVVIFLTKLVVLKNVDLRPVWYYYLCKVRSERVKTEWTRPETWPSLVWSSCLG